MCGADNGDIVQATDAYKQVLAANPFARPAQIELSRMLYARGELDTSNELIARVLTRVPNDQKTQLSLAVARRLSEAFDDTFVLELASISDPQLVASTIARTLGVPHTRIRSRSGPVTEANSTLVACGNSG